MRLKPALHLTIPTMWIPISVRQYHEYKNLLKARLEYGRRSSFKMAANPKCFIGIWAVGKLIRSLSSFSSWKPWHLSIKCLFLFSFDLFPDGRLQKNEKPKDKLQLDLCLRSNTKSWWRVSRNQHPVTHCVSITPLSMLYRTSNRGSMKITGPKPARYHRLLQNDHCHPKQRRPLKVNYWISW